MAASPALEGPRACQHAWGVWFGLLANIRFARFSCVSQVYNPYQHFESSHNAMIFIFSLLSVARGVYTVASVDESKATFMIMAGITSGSEMCLVAEGGATGVDGASVMLEPCLESLAAGDGRELWKFSSGGAIQSSEGNKCLKVHRLASGVGGWAKVDGQANVGSEIWT